MSKSLEGRVAVVTGASRGLGRAMAVGLAEEGASLALLGRDAEALEQTAAACRAAGAESASFLGDVADEAQVERLSKEVAARFGRADILINNAGINIRKPVVDFTLDEWNEVMRVNLTGVFLMCRAFVPLMKGRGYGRILNMTSIMSHVAMPMRAAYCASKAGLLGFSRVLSQELAPEGITVVCISPGPFATEMNAPLINDPQVQQSFTSRIPLARWGKVEEVGKLAAFLCSDGAGFITGTDILIDGGWTSQ
jgi:NAD(P)-dependent dehydrogenase (short-subunit alcohol dehydrogenase family)